MKFVMPAHRLYVGRDGLRLKITGGSEKVGKVRDLIKNGVDRICEITTLFREQNYSCRYAVNSAIDWYFQQEEEGIILEDDCLPHRLLSSHQKPVSFRVATNTRKG